jgi:hypothetical protein
MKPSSYLLTLAGPVLGALFSACASITQPSMSIPATTAAVLNQDELKLAEYENQARLVTAHLETFDDLDYNVFSNGKWRELQRSHAPDVTVHWPDGHVTHGIEKHIEDLKAMFVWAPDTRIKLHPVKLGQQDWTAVVGIMEGTFSQPMPMADGTVTLPTGKAYKTQMATIGRWKKGVMEEEYLFWDNAELRRQIGVAK